MEEETKYLSEQFERIVIEREDDGEPVAVITLSDIEPALGYVARCKPKA